MPLGPAQATTPLGRELGALALSCVQVTEPMALLRAAQWRNALAKVGVGVPFFAVHDLGLLATVEPQAAPIGARPFVARAAGALGRAAPLVEAWAETLRELAASEVMERARAWRLADDLLTVLLLRVLGPVWERHLGPGRRPPAAQLPLEPELYRELAPELPTLFEAQGDAAQAPHLAFLERLVKERVRLIASVEQVDLDTLRMLGMFGAGAGTLNALSLLDLLNVFGNAQANDVVNFSLDLLPSILETRRAGGSQAFAVDGYAGLERRGTLDSLVLSELAFDPELFDRRFAENEVFYYAREKPHDQQRQLHYLCIDASASMRGQRATFARGLALTLAKKLMLRGEEVRLRFFDARLYDAQQVRPGRSGEAGLDVPYILCFKGERGRNYARVFSLLADDLQRIARRERRSPIVYVFTHAECHVPVETVARLRELAQLYGVFLLPSTGALHLEYLSLLHTVQIVEERALYDREARNRRALDILDDATAEPSAGSGPARTAAPSAKR